MTAISPAASSSRPAHPRRVIFMPSSHSDRSVAMSIATDRIAKIAAMPRRSAADAARTRTAILERSVDLASVEGLEGLTIGRLAADLQMSKAGVLGHFGTKEELQLAALGAARERLPPRDLGAGRQAAAPGRARLLAIADAWLSYLGRDVFPGGCFVAAASCEFDDRPGRVRDAIAAMHTGLDGRAGPRGAHRRQGRRAAARDRSRRHRVRDQRDRDGRQPGPPPARRRGRAPTAAGARCARCCARPEPVAGPGGSSTDLRRRAAARRPGRSRRRARPAGAGRAGARRKYSGASCSHVAPMPPCTLMFDRAAKSSAAPAAERAALAASGNSAGASARAQQQW